MMQGKKFISPGAWFSMIYPSDWSEFEDGEGSFLFYNPDVWTGNFRISAYKGDAGYGKESIQQELKENGAAVTVDKGSVLVFRGDTLKFAYIMLKGELGIVYDAKEGKSHLYNCLMPFKIISDIEVLADEDKYCSTVIAEKDSLLFRIPIRIFRHCMETCPEFSREVIRTFASCAYQISMKRGFQAYGSATQRLAIHLTMTAAVRPPNETNPFVVDKTRQTLAEELELSVKTINRSIDTLKADGYLSIRGGKINIGKKQYEMMKENFL